MERLIRFSGVGKGDSVLDVACGPGLVTCAFAAEAGQVTGIDLTPAMIAKAKEGQRARGLTNVTWDLGESTALPYRDDTFSLVITRYSFHHFPEPHLAWKEMRRVCVPGGIVMVVDVALPEEKREKYDEFERIRDPSHTSALTLEEFPQMAREVGLREVRTDFYRLEMELEQQLKASFPEAGTEECLRNRLLADLGKDHLGLQVEEREGKIWFSYPTFVIAGRK